MSSFSSKKVLILALIAISINGVISVGVNQPGHGNCSSQPEKPDENFTFAATDDDTAGVEIYSFIEVKRNDTAKSFIPLKLEKVEQLGHLGQDQNATLRLVMDCATIELDLTVEVEDREYNGKSIQARVTYEGEQKVIDKSFLSFKKYIYRGSAGYSMSWNNLPFESGSSNYTVSFVRWGFIMESKNVTYNYENRITNDVGFRGGWY